MLDFDSDPLTFDPTLFFDQNYPKIAKSHFTFLDFGYPQVETKDQVWTKKENFFT